MLPGDAQKPKLPTPTSSPVSFGVPVSASSSAADIGRAILEHWGLSGASSRGRKRFHTSAEATKKKTKLQAESVLSDLVDGGQPDRPDSDDDPDVEPPERQADSDDDDFFDMKPAAKNTLSQEYLGSPRM